MPTKKEVDEFFSDNYYHLLQYIMNKKRGGNRLTVDEDGATEILHDCYIYLANNPKHFSSKHIYNLLGTRRKNYYRDKDRYNCMKDNFFLNYFGENKTNCLISMLIEEELVGMIREHINEVANRKHRNALVSHFIYGEEPDRKYRTIVYLFKEKMVREYGEIWREGCGTSTLKQTDS